MTAKSGNPRDDLSLPLIGMFCLILVGGLLVLDFVPELWAMLSYVEGRCVLLDKRLVENPPVGNGTFRPEFLIRYTVDGRVYQTFAYRAVKSSSGWRWPEERVLERFTVGQEYPCWYDAADPSKVVFVRGFSWFTYVLLPVFVLLAYLTGKGFLWRMRGPGGATGEAGGAEASERRSSIVTTVDVVATARFRPCLGPRCRR
jgi:hypothetical protein